MNKKSVSDICFCLFATTIGLGLLILFAGTITEQWIPFLKYGCGLVGIGSSGVMMLFLIDILRSDVYETR